MRRAGVLTREVDCRPTRASAAGSETLPSYFCTADGSRDPALMPARWASAQRGSAISYIVRRRSAASASRLRRYLVPRLRAIRISLDPDRQDTAACNETARSPRRTTPARTSAVRSPAAHDQSRRSLAGPLVVRAFRRDASRVVRGDCRGRLVRRCRARASGTALKVCDERDASAQCAKTFSIRFATSSRGGPPETHDDTDSSPIPAGRGSGGPLSSTVLPSGSSMYSEGPSPSAP